jgi:hypothetical protein
MKKIIILFTALSLSACATMNNPVSTTNLYDIESAYYAAEQVALVYMRLPLCKTGTTTSLTNQCGRRSVKVKIQNAARTAQVAIIAARNFVRNNPTINDLTLLTAAQTALTNFQSVLTAQGN